MDFDRLKDPEPKYFEEILRNSLSFENIQQFCADFLALFRPREHKQPVPCAIGSADSGKTSLFAPVFQIVPLNRIARVTKQKSFNKAMIDNSTEIIFLDEAFPGLLEIDDWKILCQGGFTSHDVKWKKAEGFHCTASMYITCQTEMDFGVAHNEAMDKRLHKYYLKSLPRVEPDANKWLREHAMECIVWAQNIVGSTARSATPEPVVSEQGLPEDDLQNILTVSLIDEEAEDSNQPQCSQAGARSTQSSSESDADDSDAAEIEVLRVEHAKASEGSLRQRHLKTMLANLEKSQKAKKRLSKTVRNYRLASHRAMLVDLGVVDQSEVSQLVTDPDEPLPAYLEKEQNKALEEKQKRLEEKQRRKEQENIRIAFENPWLLNMEKEMTEQSIRMEDPRDEEERQVMQSLLEINCDKLRSYHERHGTLSLPAAVEERKRLCLSNQLVDPSCVNLVRDLYSPLPVKLLPASQCSGTPLRSSHSSVEEEEEDIWLITPRTPTYTPHNDLEPLCPPSPVMAFNPAKRRRVQSQAHEKRQKKLTSFFQSQS